MSEQADGYAQALMQFGAEEWIQQLTSVQHRLWQNPGIINVLSDPNTQPTERRRALVSLISDDMRPEVSRLVHLLAQQGGIREVGEIIQALRTRVSALALPDAEVTSAQELSDEEKGRIEARLRADHGDSLKVAYEVNPDIIGGLLIRVGDKVMDYSVAARFNALRERLVG